MKTVIVVALYLSCSFLMTPSRAEIVSASATHFELRHAATSSLAPRALWQRLVNPAEWWHPEHTYSGDAGNLSLEAQAGGLWLESWEGGSVAHGQVLLVEDGTRLRMEAPFGPLQEIGAYSIWTITIAAHEGGSTVVFNETAIGPPGANLEEIAKAVDYVKGEAISRLVTEHEAAADAEGL